MAPPKFCSATILSAFHLWCELVAEVRSHRSQTLDTNLLMPLFRDLHSFVHVGLAPPQQTIDECSQLPGCGKYCHVGSDAPPNLAIVGSQCRVAVA